ncbi:MAG TPA: FG-GAP repeat protein, partial [bacterium]|nr:FG-GAP repeat protein [bacterium]
MRHFMQVLLYCLVTFVFLSGVTADTQWVDMVSPINHSQWPDIAVADFNNDGIADIVAANPDADEAYSDYSGLPVWTGKIYNGPSGGYYWGLASGPNPDGTTASLPVPDPGNIGNAHIACVFPGNSCNMMAEWTFEITHKSGVERVYTTSGTSSFTATVSDNVHWPDRYHSYMDEWTFRQQGTTDNFSASSQRFGGSMGIMTLGQEFTSANGAITLTCNRSSPGMLVDEEFVVVTHPPYAKVSGIARGHGEITLQNFEFDSRIKPVEWFYDRTNLMKVRFDISQDDVNCYVGDTYRFHTPQGPRTDFEVGGNKSYKAVEAADVNMDGQIDIIGAGPNGVDIYYQTGPSISDVGFIDEGFPLDGSPHLNVILGMEPSSTFPDGYIDHSAVYDELWNVEWTGGGFQVYGEILGSGADFWEYYAVPNNAPNLSFCHEITLQSAADLGYSSGDRYTFSTKRVNFGERSGP